MKIATWNQSQISKFSFPFSYLIGNQINNQCISLINNPFKQKYVIIMTLN